MGTGSNLHSGLGKSNAFGSSSLIPNTGGARSSFGKKAAGAGILAAGAGLLGSKAMGKKSGFKMNPFGTSQYSSFGKPKKSFGSFLFGKKSYGAKTNGYGTNFGTNFGGGVGRYGTGKKGYGKKALGLGVAAGFLGG